MLLAGNGGVVWAEQRVDSGLAALLVATEPLWIVLLLWLRPAGERPGMRVALGLGLGLAGMAFLVRPESGGADPVGAAVLLLASLGWAWGSLYGRRAPIPGSTLLTTGMQMLWGGAMLVAAGLLTGEPARLTLAAVSVKSLLALGYLVVAGLVAFTCYAWLLSHASPVLASTHAYVNPVVAVLLGGAFAGEPLTAAMLGAAAVIVAGVALITSAPEPAAGPEPARDEAEPERAAA
jgi:drug/metabolite transporter (DMT)-like permease